MSTLRAIVLRDCGVAWTGCARSLHLIVLLVIFGVVIGALRGSVPPCRAGRRCSSRPRASSSSSSSGDAARAGARGGAQARSSAETLLWDLTDAHPRRRQGQAHPGAGARPGEVRRRGPAGARGARRGHPRIPRQRQEGHRLRHRASRQERYYLAAQADEIYSIRMGFVLIDGYDRYRMYFKDRSTSSASTSMCSASARSRARSRYTRAPTCRAEDAQESRAYLDALWTSYQEAVTTARKLPAGCARSYVDTLPQTVPAARRRCGAGGAAGGLVTGDQDAAAGASRR